MSRIIRGLLNQRKVARWNDTPKDLVILHCFGRDKTIPSGSPYVMKIDGKDPFGEKGKAPWVSLNGQHISDSEFIIAFLNREFNKDLNKEHPVEQLALGTAVRVMLEDQFSWGMALERFVFNPQEFRKVFGKNLVYDTAILTFGGYVAFKRAVAQGIGAHSREEIEGIEKDLAKTIAQFLASLVKQFGDSQILTMKNWCTDEMGEGNANVPQDVVILHTLPRGKPVPNPSPFAMKLETYLRMAKITYELDFENPWGAKGKTPWITLNGEHISDSQMIIERLRNERKIVIGNYSEEQRAVARAGIGLWRWNYSGGKGLEKIFDMPAYGIKLMFQNINKRLKETAWAQGIGRHSQEQVIEMTKEVLRNSSLILGNKKFLLGDEPCEEDCSFFGFLSMVKWAAPGSPHEKYFNEELENLNNYCNRMKERFWSDWDDCLAKPK
ncbi:hypothetical protein Ocin01_20029 [Orchesella cincta]|uniref:Failed axon connections n=1 Tax=Orchesella cincta TaxID=48709 RepID=A0A1D2M114_ORCCI|nr:hypothetical protein Ocin01_20029 [Orchesella cincta]